VRDIECLSATFIYTCDDMLSVNKLNVFVLNVVLLSATKLNVVMLIVMVPEGVIESLKPRRLWVKEFSCLLILLCSTNY